MEFKITDYSIKINEKEQLLLQAFSDSRYNADILGFLLSDLDVTNANFYYLLALANYADAHSWEYIDCNKKEWIAGILRQTRIRNIMTTAATKKLLSEIDARNIPASEIILVRDMPMKLYYDPKVVRVIIGAPVLTSSEYFEEVCNIAETINAATKYHFEKISVHSNCSELGISDIHPVCLRCDTGRTWFPSPEECLVILLNYYAGKMKQHCDGNIVFKAYYDAAVLLKKCDSDILQECIESSCMGINEKQMSRSLIDAVQNILCSLNHNSAICEV